MTTKHASCESVAKNSPRPEIRKKMVACGSSFVLLLCTLMVDGYVEPQKCTPNGKPRCKDGLVCTPESGTWTWESTQPLVPIQWLCRQPKHSVWGTTLVSSVSPCRTQQHQPGVIRVRLDATSELGTDDLFRSSALPLFRSSAFRSSALPLMNRSITVILHSPLLPKRA